MPLASVPTRVHTPFEREAAFIFRVAWWGRPSAVCAFAWHTSCPLSICHRSTGASAVSWLTTSAAQPHDRVTPAPP